MTFISVSFFFFLTATYLSFHYCPAHYRWGLLLAASYIFYASFKAPQLLIWLGLITLTSYFYALRIKAEVAQKNRTEIFWFGTVLCIFILIASRYLAQLLPLELVSREPRLVIFVGVSYFSFQAISYLADVYLGIQDPEPHLGRHALALAFFPKLLQGPIERAGNLLPQLHTQYSFDYDRARSALLLFAFGLFKKMVLADRLAQYANFAFADIRTHASITLLIGSYAYAFQIYLDFSGYTDMARGSAALFGINLTENFKSPYLATSIADFWRRWHISFSRWILDYIFKPLQIALRDISTAGTAIALLATFLISGLWHGFAWNFIVWGLIHGIYLATSVYYRPFQRKLHAFLGGESLMAIKCWRVFATFNLVTFAWIFFRADSLSDAAYIVRNIFTPAKSIEIANGIGLNKFFSTHVLMGYGYADPAILLFAFAFIYIAYRFKDFNILAKPTWFRWGFYYATFAAIVFLGIAKDTFVYFRF